jgi:hypothetical protein
MRALPTDRFPGADPPLAKSLDAMCAKWQRILRLQDWDVKIQFAHSYEIPGNAGDVNFVVAKKAASIRILFPAEFDATIKFPQDIEKTIVHELVHLHFAPIDDFDGLRGRLLEQAVECIASGLVERDRA